MSSLFAHLAVSDVAPGSAHTWKSGKVSSRIDKVYSSPESALHPVVIEMDDPSFSDHAPVLFSLSTDATVLPCPLWRMNMDKVST